MSRQARIENRDSVFFLLIRFLVSTMNDSRSSEQETRIIWLAGEAQADLGFPSKTRVLGGSMHTSLSILNKAFPCYWGEG